jgi:hypothetical protein
MSAELIFTAHIYRDGEELVAATEGALPHDVPAEDLVGILHAVARAVEQLAPQPVPMHRDS